MLRDFIISEEEEVLLSGASGFIGCYVVETLLKKGFNTIRCLIRETSDSTWLFNIISENNAEKRIEVIKGNLLSRDDCQIITKDVKLIYHLTAAMGTKIFSEAFLNSVVTTRNLIEAALNYNCLKRFVNVSSFIVYKKAGGSRKSVLDESSPIEKVPEKRSQAYCYGKVKQDELAV